MINLLKYKLNELNELFSITSNYSRINYNIVEKDFWVSIILEYLFCYSKYKNSFIFKGGTSLSKCYKIIDRFSEDVDLILKYSAVGLVENSEDLSKTSQRKLNNEIIDKTRSFLKREFVDFLNKEFKKVCTYEYSFIYDINEPDSILFYYPTNSNDNYILPYIKLEIGVLAANFPVENKVLSSIIFDYNQELDLNDTVIPVISVIRTFWEKITIIHAECKRNPDKYHRRYSRHFYDVYKILTVFSWDKLVEDKNLIKEVVRFKEKYYTQNSAKYDEVINAKLDITLSSDALNYFIKDYELMINMFIKDFPKFEELNEELKEFEEYYNSL